VCLPARVTRTAEVNNGCKIFLRCFVNPSLSLYGVAYVCHCFLERLDCHQCGQSYKEVSTLYAHAAIEHKILGACLPAKKELAIRDQHEKPTKNSSGHQPANPVQLNCFICKKKFEKKTTRLHHYAKHHFTAKVMQREESCTPGKA